MGILQSLVGIIWTVVASFALNFFYIPLIYAPFYAIMLCLTMESVQTAITIWNDPEAR
ncbi:hypothetical protein [Hoeflea sp. TYP-13]|uniref:hypothetical protein n=1 Tax=Hoeflea sp. TYP-13 TaxID=3230023 RepID=UPI0034C5D0D9